MTSGQFTRRRLLTAVGTGLATAVAGCGYQPGGGEFDWHHATGRSNVPGPMRTTDDRWFSDGSHVAHVRNRSGRTFTQSGFAEVDDAALTLRDSSGNRLWSGSTPAQYVGEPAVSDGFAYFQLEDDRVVSIAYETDGGEDGSSTGMDIGSDSGTSNSSSSRSQSSTGAQIHWETAWDGPELALRAARPGIDSSLLTGTYSDSLVCFDTDTGDLRFECAAADLVGHIGDNSTNSTTDEETDSMIRSIAIATDSLWVLIAGNPDLGHDPALVSLDSDGTVQSSVSNPRFRDVVTIGEAAIVALDGSDEDVPEVRKLAPDGEQQFTVALTETAGMGGVTLRPVSASASDTARVYCRAGDVLTAVDAASGDLAWQRDDYAFRGTLVADADGVYSWGAGPSMDGCGLVAITTEGESWWGVQPLKDVSCRDDLLLADDRLVVVADDGLYGLYKGPGRRYTLVS
ncbi:hypothetical protein C482_05972 [Natrialba chahannaoensis JCM 10990]|uniref:Pyrrolo-quinoline quinone repeat domain-containing protein n=1 Tax=Natrialba chahannaoensis JCM 10990 TaxID=1227492 RepID=M0AU97_9EURY|nr:PQQ-binding-like beta-propeller repeat protein [Natrialba chahannaoensis]ELZ01912.1 hypothetical protein C482_05972 [Natrialba chahannaoensis JCM 10990]